MNFSPRSVPHWDARPNNWPGKQDRTVSLLGHPGFLAVRVDPADRHDRDPAKLASLQPYGPPPKPKYDIIYYTGNELPRTEDVGGAQAGRSGRAGGQEAHHPTQTIRVARGANVRETVADAPKMNLPVSNSAVANLLALKALPGPRRPRECVLPCMRRRFRKPQWRRSSGTRTTAGRAHPQSRRGSTQRGCAAARIGHGSSAWITSRAGGASAGLRARANHKSNPRLAMPAPSVVAPAPTVTREVTPSGPGFGADELQKQIVPPTVQVSSISTEHRSVTGFGSTSVVPPTVQLGRARRNVLWPGDGIGHVRGAALLRCWAEFAFRPGQGPSRDRVWWSAGRGISRAPPSSNGGGSTRASWFPASLARNSACPATEAAARWLCLHPAEISRARRIGRRRRNRTW